MKRPEPDSPEAQARSQAAADWLVRRDRGLSAAEQDDFLAWLAADPRHGEWLALHRRLMGNFDALATWRPEHSEEANPDLLAPARRRVRWWMPVAVAAAAALAVLVTVQRNAQAPVEAVAGEAEAKRRILEDGSAVELNRGAVVTAAFSAAERRTALVQGEAFFAVAKNPQRPFVVEVAGIEVRAIGTAFSVRRDAGVVEVLVTEGRVAVTRKDGGGGEGARVEVSAGQKATQPIAAKATGGAVARAAVVNVAPQAVAQQLNWQPHLLDFSGAPLGVAIEEMNRRNRVQFVLGDPELATMPIVASIRSDNVEGFARFLESSPTLVVERKGEEIVVKRR
jgi:transmembrane sensor